MTDIEIITRYGRAHGLTYGKVSQMLSMGQLTPEEVGLSKPEPRSGKEHNTNTVAHKEKKRVKRASK